MYDFLIVGAGFSGSVVARQLADRGKKVLLVDRRSHIGGNAHDKTDENGVVIHPYGPHIFHTNSKKVIEFLSRFTDWRFYEHRVLAVVDGKQYPLPINRTTVNQLYRLDLDEKGVENYFESVRQPKNEIRSSEDVVLNSVGHDLCEKFFRGYTKKQWGMDLSELSAGVAARIPTRTNDDDRYFTDTYQFMPSAGYTSMFEKIIDSPLIELRLGTDFKDIKSQFFGVKIIFTGPIDEYYESVPRGWHRQLS
jgi:UDP-galactopyranose mutase